MSLPSIAILDLIGLVYDGSTLSKKGLGGSESAVILMAKELAALGFPTTVFNACNYDDAQPGVYDGVTYRPVDSIKQEEQFDILISSRTVIPFVPEEGYNAYRGATAFPCELFEGIRKKAQYKVLWLHDTFIRGDQDVEPLVVNGHIDRIFTLSDFHTAYISNCDHGRRRNFEVLKNKIFVTRNGIVRYFDEVDIKAKDKNLFVYNASLTKGLLPLVDRIWPEIKKHIPEAKLKVIGGYYKFRSDSPLDDQGIKLTAMAKEKKYADLDIEFTGVIPQKEIAEILSQAYMFLFPGAFPETFGISTLESLNYNTPLVTCRFGAAEETAVEQASYFIDYAIEPNSLFPNINTDLQVAKYLDVFFRAYSNPYLHQQKQYYCNIVKDISTWDTVALQWKQHFLKVFGQYMNREEYRKVCYINERVHKVFGRRFSNPEEWVPQRVGKERKINVITPFFNAANYLRDLIISIATQDYDNYQVHLINDRSTDSSLEVIHQVLRNLPENIAAKFKVVSNLNNMGAVYNQINAIRGCEDGSLIMLIDGDDSLMPDNNIFNYYNKLFAYDKTEYAYGSCWSMADNIPLIAQPYPKAIKSRKMYRMYRFNWNMPYPHLRVFRKELINKLPDSVFKDENGNWYRAGGDNATFYNIIEQADPDKVVAVQDIFYRYNDLNPLNDYKVNGDAQNLTAKKILGEYNPTPEFNLNDVITELPNISPDKANEYLNGKKETTLPARKKKILIAIPTAKNIEPTTFKAIFDLEVPEGYETQFQYFYGYNVDQVRNLIASWIVNGDYDYLFAVDYDIAFPPDTLKKLLSHDKDVVSGVYIQRFTDRHVVELFDRNDHGGYNHIPWEKIKGQGLVRIGACGFGCVLIKKQVMVDIGYPQFQYFSALDHKDTFSEDLDFARKAAAKGFEMYADTSVICDHYGTHVYKVNQ